MRTKCKMCKIKRPLWESKSFLGVKCNKHFVPLIILKEHRIELTEDEKIELENVREEKYPKLFLDVTISDSDEHWHIHLLKKKNGNGK
jgi:hypothetical protein